MDTDNLFQRDSFILHSGGISDFKIDCDALTDEDIETIAYLISKQVRFKDVVGVPSGGLRLEKALEQYMSERGCHLIADDVLTTGGSMEAMKKELYGENAIGIKGVVIFARNKYPDWIRPVFKMWED